VRSDGEEGTQTTLNVGLMWTWLASQSRAFVDGTLRLILKGDTIVADFLRILDDYVEKCYAGAR